MSNKDLYMDRRMLRTKRLCKQAMLFLLKQKPFNEITVTDIVKLAKINRGTFYNHYKQKEDLLVEVIDEVVSDLIRSYREPYQSKKTFKISDLPSSSVKLFDSVYQHADFYTMIVNSNVLLVFQNKLCEEIQKIALNELSNYNPIINVELNACYQAYAIAGLIIEWVKGGFKYSPKYMAEQLMEIVKIPPNQTLHTMS